MEMDKQSPDAAPWLDYLGLDLPFEGIYNFREKHKKGAWIFGLRAGFEFNRFGLSIIVNNLLNTEYALRPLCVEAPRTVTLQLNYKFNDFNVGKIFNKQKKVDLSEIN
ncbi:MAG: hypothetical protein RR190_04740 [Bacteroidales bacterium]